jgi:hypothetical protein
MNIAVFDIDGCIADSWHRREYIRGSKPDWDKFHKACGDDPVLPLAKVAETLASVGWTIMYVTKRPEEVRMVTEQWLMRVGLLTAYNKANLIMTTEPDVREHSRWKVHTVERIIEGADEALIFEDDPQLIAAYRNRKLPVVPIFSGYYNWTVRP